MLGFVTVTAALASSVFSAPIISVSEHLHIGTEVGVLGVSLMCLDLLEDHFCEQGMYGGNWHSITDNAGVVAGRIRQSRDSESTLTTRF